MLHEQATSNLFAIDYLYKVMLMMEFLWLCGDRIKLCLSGKKCAGAMKKGFSWKISYPTDQSLLQWLCATAITIMPLEANVLKKTDFLSSHNLFQKRSFWKVCNFDWVLVTNKILLRICDNDFDNDNARYCDNAKHCHDKR